MSQTITKDVRVDTLIGGHRDYHCVTEIFNDVKEVIEVTKTRELHSGCGSQDYLNTNRIGIDEDFHGVESYEEFEDLALNGYNCDLAEALKSEMKVQLRNTQVRKRTETFNDVVGFVPNVPLAIMGVPTSMVNSRTRVIKRKCVNIFIDVAVPARCSTEKATECYKQVLRNVMQLEADGYAVRITAISTFARDVRIYSLAVRIKNEGQRFNLKSMCFPLAHPSFERILAFGWYTRHPQTEYMFRCGRALDNEAKRNNFKGEDLLRSLYGSDASCISIAAMIDLSKADRAKYLNTCLQR